MDFIEIVYQTFTTILQQKLTKNMLLRLPQSGEIWIENSIKRLFRRISDTTFYVTKLTDPPYEYQFEINEFPFFAKNLLPPKT